MKKILVLIFGMMSFFGFSQDTLNVYIDGNLLIAADSLNGIEYVGLSRDVVVYKLYNDTTLFYFTGINNTKTYDITELLKADDTQYSEADWLTFYTESLGGLSGENMATSDLTFTGDRTHSMGTYDLAFTGTGHLSIPSLSYLYFDGANGGEYITSSGANTLDLRAGGGLGIRLQTSSIDLYQNTTLTGYLLFDDPGTDANSFVAQWQADNSTTVQTSSLQTIYGADPYFQLKAPNNSGTATVVADFHDTNITWFNGAAGVDYKFTFNGESNDGTITYDEDNDGFIFNNDGLFGGALTATAIGDGTVGFTSGIGTGLVSLTDGTASWASSSLTGLINLDFTGHLYLPLTNDAATPTINFGDDADGIYSSADGNLDFATNGTHRFNISDSGASITGDLTLTGDIIGEERTLVYNIPVDGVTSTGLVWIGEQRQETSGETTDYTTDYGLNNQHAAIDVTSLTGSGLVTFTGVSMSEGTAAPTATTESFTIDAVSKYQTSKKWIEVTNIAFAAGITDIVYDLGVLGYVDMQNKDFKITGMRVDMLSSGVSSQLVVHIKKIQDEGNNKLTVVDVEKYGISALTDAYVDEVRTGGDDRSYTLAASDIWTDGENACLKVSDYDTYFIADENIFESSTKNEGFVIELDGIAGGSINNVGMLNLHLTIVMQ